MKYVNQPVRKTDAMSLVTGKPVYTDDLAPKDCLIVKVTEKPPRQCLGRRYQDRHMRRKLQALYVSLLIRTFRRNVLHLPVRLHRR